MRAADGRQHVTPDDAGDQPPRRFSLERPVKSHKNSANISRVEAILAGLPAHVMDELVEDLADAVVAMLLSQAATEPDEDEHESGNLRKIQL